MKRGDVSKGSRRCIQRPGSLPDCTCAEHTANRRVTCAQPKHCIPFVLPRCDSCWRRGSSALNSEILRLSLPPNRAGGSPSPRRCCYSPGMALPGSQKAEPLPGRSRALRPGAGRAGCAGKPVVSRWCCWAGNEHQRPGRPPAPTHPCPRPPGEAQLGCGVFPFSITVQTPQIRLGVRGSPAIPAALGWVLAAYLTVFH